MVLIHTDFNFPIWIDFDLLASLCGNQIEYILSFSDNLERWPREGSSPFFLPATETIPSFINHFEEMCTEHMHRWQLLIIICIHVFKGIQYQIVRDGEEMRDPFGERRGKFQWKALSEKLAMLRENNPQWFVEVSNSWRWICEVNLCVCRERVRILVVKIVNSAIPEKTLHWWKEIFSAFISSHLCSELTQGQTEWPI